MAKLRVAVLMGGASAERSVSLSTGKQILEGLNPAKYTIYALDTLSGQTFLPAGMRLESLTSLATGIERAVTSLTELPLVDPAGRPDVVVIALHGPGGEDGTVQGMLDVLGIPYTGSGVLGSAMAMDKAITKRLLTGDGIRVARSAQVTSRTLSALDDIADMPLPWVIKPNSQGSTIGMSIVRETRELEPALDLAFSYDHQLLIEQFIEGTEITVPILGNEDLEVLPIVEIVPASGFYDFEAKYTPGATDEICPARIDPGIADEAREIAQHCHRLLRCRGMSRTDMIVDPAGKIYTLETNTIPGMTPTSLLPRSASVAGYTFSDLLDKLIGYALDR